MDDVEVLFMSLTASVSQCSVFYCGFIFTFIFVQFVFYLPPHASTSVPCSTRHSCSLFSHQVLSILVHSSMERHVTATARTSSNLLDHWFFCFYFLNCLFGFVKIKFIIITVLLCCCCCCCYHCLLIIYFYFILFKLLNLVLICIRQINQI